MDRDFKLREFNRREDLRKKTIILHGIVICEDDLSTKKKTNIRAVY